MAPPDIRVYIHSPVPIFRARINTPGAVTYPVTTLTFDTVTVGAFGDIQIDSTLLLGTTEGGDDLGRVRVQGAATSSTIPVGRISEGTHDGELAVADNAYITVWDDFRVWAKTPFIDDDGVQYKDSDIEVGDLTEEIPPVANMGPGFADTIDPITEVITVNFGSATAYAMADGATIVSVLWNVGDGTITSGTSASASITATFPAGFRWVSLTVTDSNGKTHTSRRPVYARDPDDDTSLPDTYIQISGHGTQQEGQAIDLRALVNVPQVTYPDGTLVMVWDGPPTDAPVRDNIVFIGWLQTDSSEARGTRTGLLRDTVLHCVDVAGRLKTLPGFSQTVTIPEGASVVNWSEMVAPTMDKYMHYILHWHSTAIALADFFLSNTGDDYPFVLFSSEGENLWAQVQNEAKAIVPGHIMSCNRRGQIAVNVEPLLQDPADRIGGTLAIFDEADTESIQYDYTRVPDVCWVRGHALLTATDYTLIDSVEMLLTVECIAPGTAPGQGVSELELPEGLAQTQEALNSAIGHHYARINSRFGLVRVVGTGDEDPVELDPANPGWIALTVTAATATQRGLTFTLLRTRCKEINFRYDHTRTGTVRRTEFLLEVETVGRPALTVYPEGAPTPPETIPPPDFGLISGQELVAGIGLTELYRTADFQTVSGSGGPTWTAHSLTTEDILSWVVDPFSPGYLTGTGTVNGWVVTATDIYRVTDIFGTVACTSIHTFAVPLGSASVPGQEWRTIQASFGTYFVEGLNPWLMVVSHYADSAGHTGTWALRSLNGGASWFPEVQISEYYSDSAVAEPFQMGVYLSPKTPGYAVTTAFVEAGDADKMPKWGILPEGGSLAVYGPTARIGISTFATSTGGSGDYTLLISPPAAAVRIKLRVGWKTLRIDVGFGGATNALSLNGAFRVNNSGDSSNFTNAPGEGGIESGSYDPDWEPTTPGDWGINAEDLTVSSDIADGVSWLLQSSMSGSASNKATAAITVTVLEVEFAGGEIYVPPAGAASGKKSLDWGATWAAESAIDPGNALGGDIHVPWEDNADESIVYHGYADMTANRQFRLKRVNADGSIDDISPIDSVAFGVNHYGFAIRAYDSDRDFVLAAVTGNDTTASASNDLQAVYVSDSGGDDWTEVVAPATGTEPYGAAFAGDTEDVIFIWGPSEYMGYSSDFGVTVDSRSGNLAALSAEPLCGICGGPTP